MYLTMIGMNFSLQELLMKFEQVFLGPYVTPQIVHYDLAGTSYIKYRIVTRIYARIQYMHIFILIGMCVWFICSTIRKISGS